jgi:hypothetical protein
MHKIGGAQLFMAPTWTPDQKGVRVQIVDIFALKLAIGYEKDPAGRLKINADSAISRGRTWSLAKACQLVRNDTNPGRWFVLHRHKKAWGLFWAGGGLSQCRNELAETTEVSCAIVPATPEALLRLVLATEEPDWVAALEPKRKKRLPHSTNTNGHLEIHWKGVAIALMGGLILMTAFCVHLGTSVRQQGILLERLADRLLEKNTK